MSEGTFGAPDYPHVPMPTIILLDEDLSDSAKMLWALLYQYAATGGGNPFEMTLEGMCELSGGAKATVVKRKKELVASGWLDEHGLRGLGRSNIYSIRTPDQDAPVPAPTDGV